MSYHHILLIDDDEDDQEIFLMAMQEITGSVECTALNSAVTALQKLKTRQTLADLIFLDLNMPIMNGKQFLGEMMKSEELRQIPVIVFSTSAQLETIRETKELGARDFITKPPKFSELKSILRPIFARMLPPLALASSWLPFSTSLPLLFSPLAACGSRPAYILFLKT